MTFDTSVASQARMYDYLLGGKDNYAADREAVEQALKVWPDMPFTARANRAFLGRAVGYFAREAGVRQFLDIGTGIPTAGNTHQVAQAIAPGSRVVYVDYDPAVLAHARALLTSNEQGATDYIDADLRDTGVILSRASQLLDSQLMRMRFTSRNREQVARFFEGTELIGPGLVRVEEWRPDPATSGAGRSSLWCGVGRKR